MVIGEKSQITDAEWEIMRVVWTLHQATSKEISKVLESKRNWKPATTKTLIGRLVSKGMLKAATEGKSYVYTAEISENESLKSVKDALFNRVCNKEVGKNIAGIISDAALSQSDIKLLEDVLKMKKKDAVEEIRCNCVPGQCQCNHDMKHH